MASPLAWDIMNKVVIPRAEKKGVTFMVTVMSTKDWDKGVALRTNLGAIHVLGTGEVIDESNVLAYPEYDTGEE